MSTTQTTEKAEAHSAEKSAKHTPGPWKVYKDEDGFEVRAKRMGCTTDNPANRWTLAVVGDSCFWDSPKHKQEDHANARLMAAAPELLQTIRGIQHNAQVMNQAEPNRVWTAIDDACLAAIAKAEKGAQ